MGWPPVRAYRMNSMVSQTKLPVTEVFNSLIGKNRNTNTTVGKETNNSCDKSNVNAKVKGHSRSSLFVKVNMDGTPIGRKVDLNSHSCYGTLTQKLEDMFQTSSTMMNSIRECFYTLYFEFQIEELRTLFILWFQKTRLSAK